MLSEQKRLSYDERQTLRTLLDQAARRREGLLPDESGGLGPTEARILDVLKEGPAMRSELTIRLGVSVKAIIAALAVLRARGLVRRKPGKWQQPGHYFLVA